MRQILKSNYGYLVAVFTVALLWCIVANSCEKPRLVNMTKTWDSHDQATLDDAANRGCKKHFADMPCLKVFIKLNERDYSVICGKGTLPEAMEWRAYNAN